MAWPKVSAKLSRTNIVSYAQTTGAFQLLDNGMQRIVWYLQSMQGFYSSKTPDT